MTQHVFKLDKGVETDLIENADTTIAALNVLRFLLIRDKANNTDIYDYLKDIEESFLKPLRSALDLSRAHYKNEESLVKSGKDQLKAEETLMSVNVLGTDGDLPVLDEEKKLNIIYGALNTFDMIDCLLSRVMEIIEG